MMPDLRARLKAVAEKQQHGEAAPVCECRVLESRMPLGEAGDLLSVRAEHIRWLGLDFPEFDVYRTLFFDTETTGLHGAGTVAFLVGLGWIDGDALVVRQLLIRDYSEEVAMLSMVADLLPRFTSLVSFNGKTFDVPLLRDRFTMARLRDRWHELPHLDLLHAARRTWKLRLGDCSLGNVEAMVLGVERENDLPGAEVPERFFRYLKTGDASLLEDVLRHNAQDVQTLALLLTRLSAAYAAPETQTSLLDVFSIGRALEKRGEGERARHCFQAASVSHLSQQARQELALSFRRAGDYAQAAEAYRGMIERGEGGVAVYISLAILQERRLCDPRGALATVERALLRFAGGNDILGVDTEAIEALTRRRARLRKNQCS